ncbi:MAG: hypothetical protein CM15mP114_08060 [Alphaproteobacteria bacterium]|nr:MAG: hypothetical protein CM15mP114_08060 [Alphaproteobacteria bacterium]
MELNDEITIPAKLDLVYKSLNDLEVLKACIPGCEELVENEDGNYQQSRSQNWSHKSQIQW